MYGGGWFGTVRNRFKVFVKPGFDPHFKEVMKTFDSEVSIVDKSTFYLVETKIEMQEIQGFTMVKNVVKVNLLEEV